MATLLLLALAVGCSSTSHRDPFASLPDAYSKAAGVTFTIYKNARWDEENVTYVWDGRASGIGFREDGWVLTNAHVIRGADSVTVVGPDGVGRKADRWFWEGPIDVAVVHVPDLRVPVAELRDSDALRIGQMVFVVGNPSGYKRSLTVGVVSGLHRGLAVGGRQTWTVQDYIQTSAQVNPCNSGGGLFDAQGQVEGLVCSSMSALDEKIPAICFAIPIRHAAGVARRMIKEEGPIDQAAMRGVRVRSADNLPLEVRREHRIGANTGVMVARVEPYSLAECAGLMVGDVILRIEGEPVANYPHYRALTVLREPGEEIRLSVERGGEMMEVTVTLGER